MRFHVRIETLVSGVALLLLTSAPVKAGLVEIVAEELSYDLQVDELKELQRRAQFDYSDEYANYKLDLKELEAERSRLLEHLSDEQKRRDLEESGALVQFQLKYYANLVRSLRSQERRINALLMLKDLRMDILNRLPAMTEADNAVIQQMADKYQSTAEENRLRLAEVTSQLQDLVRGKEKEQLTSQDRQKIVALRRQYDDAARHIRGSQNELAKYEQKLRYNSKSIQVLQKAQGNLEHIMERLEEQRGRLLSQARVLKDDITTFNVNVTVQEVIGKIDVASSELHALSSELDSFVADYAELEAFQETIYTESHLEREEVTLEKIMSEVDDWNTESTSDEEMLDWINSL